MPKLPDGPRGKYQSTLGVIRDPRNFFAKSISKYGDPFLFCAMNGPVLVTGKSEYVEQIFRAPPDTFGVFARDSLIPLLGAGSLLLMEGPPHREQRKRTAPPLNGGCMRAYGQAMQDTAQLAINRRESGVAFTGLQLGTEVSLDVILQTILGADSEHLLSELRKSTRKALARAWPILFFSPKTQFRFLGLSPMDRLRRAQQQLREQLRIELDRRGDQINVRNDMLSILARPTEDSQVPDFDELADSVGTLMFAGHETTAVSIAWAIYHLHRHPGWLNRLRDELDASDGRADTYATMPLLKAIIQETLRLNPIVTEVLRTVREPFQLGSYDIPLGYAVAAASCVTHYDPEIYEDPESFNPQRFLDHSFTPTQYYPFGGGGRRCVGASFATYELAIVLGTILRSHELELLDQKEVVPVRRNITMGPSSGVRLRVRSRR